jgi:hypothetical protein
MRRVLPQLLPDEMHCRGTTSFETFVMTNNELLILQQLILSSILREERYISACTRDGRCDMKSATRFTSYNWYCSFLPIGDAPTLLGAGFNSVGTTQASPQLSLIMRSTTLGICHKSAQATVLETKDHTDRTSRRIADETLSGASFGHESDTCIVLHIQTSFSATVTFG